MNAKIKPITHGLCSDCGSSKDLFFVQSLTAPHITLNRILCRSCIMRRKELAATRFPTPRKAHYA